MDRASQVLAQGVPPGVPKSYRALADHHGNVSHSTLHHRAHGRPSMKDKAQGQQYLKPYEEEVIVKYLTSIPALWDALCDGTVLLFGYLLSSAHEPIYL
jgi:hypothetical protein